MGWESWAPRRILPTAPRQLVSGSLPQDFPWPLLSQTSPFPLWYSLLALFHALLITVLRPKSARSFMQLDIKYLAMISTPLSIIISFHLTKPRPFIFPHKVLLTDFLLPTLACILHEMSPWKGHLKVTKSIPLLLLLGKLRLPDRLLKIIHQRVVRATASLATSGPCILVGKT